LNLVIRRLLKNKVLVEMFGIHRDAVLRDFQAQHDLFYRLFSAQVEQGSRKPKTFGRCADGSGKTAPRELIHLLIAVRQQEIARIERGEAPPEGDQLFDRSVFKLALPAVSEARLVQNLYAEYPDMKAILTKLRGQKTEQTTESLMSIWGLNEAKGEQQGFFKGTARARPSFFTFPQFLFIIHGIEAVPAAAFRTATDGLAGALGRLGSLG
jgi:hypothetical protein